MVLKLIIIRGKNQTANTCAISNDKGRKKETPDYSTKRTACILVWKKQNFIKQA
jgi:hypothetical protein